MISLGSRVFIFLFLGYISSIFSNDLDLTGIICKRDWAGGQIKDIVINDLINPKITVIGGNKGTVFNNGEFLIKLPRTEFPPGERIQIIITSDNYHQEAPEIVIISREDTSNKEHRFFLISNDSNPIKINGVVREKKTNMPIKGIKVFSKEFAQQTITDNDGKYQLRLFHKDNPISSANIVFQHPDNFYKPVDKLVEHIPSMGGGNFVLDAELKPNTKRQPIVATLPPNSSTPYSIEGNNGAHALPPSVYRNNVAVYFLFATAQDLIQEGILHREGMFIFKWFRRPSLKSLKPDISLFQPALKYELELINPGLKEIFFDSDVYPPRDNSSFHITHQGVLKIINPDLFWRDYNFVVLRVH